MRRPLTILLPTIDEVENLRVLVPELLALDQVEAILVIDDGSTDGTRELVSSIDPRVRLIARQGPPSLRASLQQGIDAAETELVGWMDADGTMPPEDVPRLCEAIDRGADLAIGSRFVEGGGLKGQTRGGLLGSIESLATMRDTPDGAITAAASWLLNGLLLPAVLGRFDRHDWTSGFCVARTEVVRPIRLRGEHGEYFFDLWVRAERSGARIVEIPCKMRPRMHGRSKTATSFAQLLRRGRRYLSLAAKVRREP
ncbi:MAG: glycosyltransferase [Polyangiales bacterium]